MPVYVSPFDFIGKRTALFGMTRTGKSNTVKKIIQATVAISKSGATIDGEAIKPIGQIIFDVNGEYANANQQDEGTAIFEQYPDDVTRYSVLEKPGFKVMKLNFYREIAGRASGCSRRCWRTTPPTTHELSATSTGRSRTRATTARRRATSGRSRPTRLPVPRRLRRRPDETVKFTSSKEIRESDIPGLDGVEPEEGPLARRRRRLVHGRLGELHDVGGPFETYKQQNGGREWADEDLQTLMRFLTRKPKPGGSAERERLPQADPGARAPHRHDRQGRSRTRSSSCCATARS